MKKIHYQPGNISMRIFPKQRKDLEISSKPEYKSGEIPKKELTRLNHKFPKNVCNYW